MMSETKKMNKAKSECIKALNYLKAGKSIVIYDVETTGLNKSKDKVIQFSAIKLERLSNGRYEFNKEKSMNILINPCKKLDPIITELTGITDSDLESMPTENDVVYDIVSILNSADVVCGYNQSKFDDVFINKMVERTGCEIQFNNSESIDVLKMVREIVEKEESGGYKLEQIAKFFNVTVNGFHNAFVDIVNTGRVLIAATRYYLEQLQDIHYTEVELSDFKDWYMSHTMNRLYFTINVKRNGQSRVFYTYYDNYGKNFAPEIEDPDAVRAKLIELGKIRS